MGNKREFYDKEKAALSESDRELLGVIEEAALVQTLDADGPVWLVFDEQQWRIFAGSKSYLEDPCIDDDYMNLTILHEFEPWKLKDLGFDEDNDDEAIESYIDSIKNESNRFLCILSDVKDKLKKTLADFK